MKQPASHPLRLSSSRHLHHEPRRLAPLLLALMGCAGLAFLHAQPPAGRGAAVPSNPFFVFDNGLNDEAHRTLAAKAKLLKELGYDGVGWRPGQVPEMRAELDQRGLKMFTIYTGARIGEGEKSYDEKLPEVIQQLKGSETIIWLTLSSRLDKPSAPTGDQRAVAVVREIAKMAHRVGLRVALYPHYGLWVQTTEDALRVVKQVNRPNVGVTFNLCHSLRAGNEARILEILRAAKPYLYLVSINGADTDGRDWHSLIQTLDRGTFDLTAFRRELQAIGYIGPIGLQCYNIPGEVRDNLTRSMRAWKKLGQRLPGPAHSELGFPPGRPAAQRSIR